MNAWSKYWLIWTTVTFLAFIIPEVWALCTNWRNTLSNQVWRFESAQAGQPIHSWSAAHFLFIGALLLLDVWLLGHFAFRWWT